MVELVRPQLASSDVPDIYTQVSWPKIIQPKLDGICCLAVNGVAMSRTMKPIPNKFIQAYFKEHGLHGFHGELMIAGDFNHWVAEPLLFRDPKGLWQRVVQMRVGRYRYKFLVDGEWKLDPSAPVQKDHSFGIRNSYIEIHDRP